MIYINICIIFLYLSAYVHKLLIFQIKINHTYTIPLSYTLIFHINHLAFSFTKILRLNLYNFIPLILLKKSILQVSFFYEGYFLITFYIF